MCSHSLILFSFSEFHGLVSFEQSLALLIMDNCDAFQFILPLIMQGRRNLYAVLCKRDAISSLSGENKSRNLIEYRLGRLDKWIDGHVHSIFHSISFSFIVSLDPDRKFISFLSLSGYRVDPQQCDLAKQQSVQQQKKNAKNSLSDVSKIIAL